MKPWMPAALLAIVLLAVAAVLFVVFPRDETPRATPGGGGKLSMATAATFDREVLKSSKPVLVDFTADWCTWCKKMEPSLERLAMDFEVRQVNFDANRALAKQYRVEGLPTLLIFVDGKVVGRHEGFTDEATLRNELTQLSKRGA